MRRRWPLLLIFTLLSGVGAYLLTGQQQKVYEARASVYVTVDTQQSTQTAADVYAGSLSSVERARSYAGLASSEQVLNRAVRGVRPAMSIDEARGALSAAVDPGTTVIEFSVRRADRRQAVELANAVASAVTAYVAVLEQNSTDGPTVKIVPVDGAAAPDSALFPDRAVQIPLAMAAALLISCAVSVALDRLSSRIRRPQDLASLPDIALLGEVPFDPALAGHVELDFTQRSTAVIEAVRRIRTALSFAAVDEPPRLLVVSSAVAGEGKSLIAVNLALAFAALGEHRVALVDANLRRPSLHAVMGIDRVGGLTDALRTHDPLAAVQSTPVTNLSVVTAGTDVVDKARILTSDTAAMFFHTLRDHFEFIIVDTSAVNSDADVAIMAGVADGVVLVARSGVSRLGDLGETIAELSEGPGRVLGLVLNGTVRDPEARISGFRERRSGDI
ncbi:hypothetical protein ASG12_18775 [Williamsia sp. Leaf354]|nr:hypothetical protein ASG12_18775 [Williamsia sp. Leaf354]